MGKALFVGLSAAFFIAYALVAQALLVPDQKTILPINNVSEGCITQGPEDDESCISDDPRTRIPILGPIVQAVASALEIGTQLFSGFFQLITFQAAGLESASLVTVLIFTPLTFINAFIIFTAIRGS